METSPSAAPHVLIYGADPTLLKTRQWLLERVGLQVSTAGTQALAIEMIEKGTVDVCVLCHTLSRDERKSLRAAAAELSPGLKILQLNKMVNHAMDMHEPDALNVADGPVALLQGVTQLLQAQGLPAQP